MNNTPHAEPQTILKAFEKLRIDQQRLESQVATKEVLAARQQDKELVKLATSYTAESIFQALAKLQSGFGQSATEWSKTMAEEVAKLAQIQRAIQVEIQRLESLRNIQIAAEALNILQQEHQQVLQKLATEYRQQQENLETEMSKQRQVWQQQQENFEKAKVKQVLVLAKVRQAEEEDYEYQIKRQRLEEANGYEQQKLTLERELADGQQTRERNWGAREDFLAKQQAPFEEYKIKVDNMAKDIEEAMKKSREEAIKETYREEENKAKLLEKEVEAKRKAAELKIESFTKTIEEQRVRIAQLSEQLQAASKQAQQLAITAVSANTGTATKTKTVDKNQ